MLPTSTPPIPPRHERPTRYDAPQRLILAARIYRGIHNHQRDQLPPAHVCAAAMGEA